MSIPGLPGVPPLKTTLKRNLISTGVVALIDAFITPAAHQIWAVYDSKGKPYLVPDSFLGLSYRDSSKVSDYPIEQGGFSSYNKVQEPYMAVVSMAKGGSLSERAQFIDTVKSMKQSTDLYSIVTPEATFINANIEWFEVDRQANSGANLIVVHMHFIEIREKATIHYSQTRSGKSISTTVPASQRTQKTTSTGVASPTSTTNPASQGVINNGTVSPATSNVSTANIL